MKHAYMGGPVMKPMGAVILFFFFFLLFILLYKSYELKAQVTSTTYQLDQASI